jgi:disulfide bond formation protein DsbB
MKLSFKVVYFLCFLVACFLIGVDAYLQVMTDIMPCFLSHVARAFMLAVAIIFLIAVLYNHTTFSRKFWSWLALLISLGGALVTGLHSWLQRGSVAQFQFSSLYAHLHNMFDPQTCVSMQWTKFGLSLANWGLIFFVLFVVICFWQQGRRANIIKK